MADGFLESKQADYERRKTEWLRKKRLLPKAKSRSVEKPEDEAL
jgi:hypothetical protein